MEEEMEDKESSEEDSVEENSVEENSDSEKADEIGDSIGKGISEAVNLERKKMKKGSKDGKVTEIPDYEFLEHVKVKFQAFGKTVEEAFSNSLIAMFSAMYEGDVQGKYSHEIVVKGKDIESLLYNFLDKFLSLFKEKGIFVSNIRNIGVDLNNYEVSCEVIGDFAKKYPLHTRINSVTYEDLKIREEKGLWVVRVVLDA